MPPQGPHGLTAYKGYVACVGWQDESRTMLEAPHMVSEGTRCRTNTLAVKFTACSDSKQTLTYKPRLRGQELTSN